MIYRQAMPLLRRVINAFYRDGARTFFRKLPTYIYRELGSLYRAKVWPRLPKTGEYGLQNSIKVPAFPRRAFDTIVPWHTKSYIPDFKSTNIACVREHVAKGDTVVSIGGGNGITNVIEATQVGDSGKVIIFEASADRVANLKETLEANGVSHRCDVCHAIVGDGQFISGDLGNPATVSPTQLPDCDILEMDCEGSELGILQALNRSPETVIVETHELKDYAPYSDVEVIIDLLKSKGYEVTNHKGPWVNSLLVGRLP